MSSSHNGPALFAVLILRPGLDDIRFGPGYKHQADAWSSSFKDSQASTNLSEGIVIDVVPYEPALPHTDLSKIPQDPHDLAELIRRTFELRGDPLGTFPSLHARLRALVGNTHGDQIYDRACEIANMLTQLDELVVDFPQHIEVALQAATKAAETLEDLTQLKDAELSTTDSEDADAALSNALRELRNVHRIAQARKALWLARQPDEDSES